MLTPSRRITLFDLLTLIAAAAVGLALLRPSIAGIRDRPLARSPGALTASRMTAAITYASCLLAPWSVALLALQLRRSRTSFHRDALGPGFIACAAATAGVGLYLTVCSAQCAMGKRPLSPDVISQITGAFANYASLMVAGAWLSLRLAARWRPEPDWTGWAGRFVGIGWIGLLLLGCLRVFA